jgi:hypothetical protein
VFYTDGLIEYARTDIDEGIQRLAATLEKSPSLSLDALCDRLLDRIVIGRADDEIAILAVRCDPRHCPPS